MMESTRAAHGRAASACRPISGQAGRGGTRPGRAYGGQPPEVRIAERRARLIEAGIELFGTHGFRAATVRGVCAAAGLTDRYFYESFDSLEALLAAVYRTLMDRLRDRLLRNADRAGTGGAGARDVERHVAAGFRVWFEMVRDARFARIVLHEVLGVSREVDALYEACTREFAELTVAPLQAVLPRARLSAEGRALLGRALVGAAIQVAAMWATNGYRQSRRAVVRTCVLVTVGTLRALGEPEDDARQPAWRCSA